MGHMGIVLIRLINLIYVREELLWKSLKLDEISVCRGGEKGSVMVGTSSVSISCALTSIVE